MIQRVIKILEHVGILIFLQLLFVAIVLSHLHNGDGDYLVLHTVDKAVFLVYAARPITCIIAHKGLRLACTYVWMYAQFLKQTFATATSIVSIRCFITLLRPS